MDNNTVVRCGNCKTILNESTSIKPDERTPCPNCGSLSRDYSVVAIASIGLSDSMEMKAKHKGKGKPFVEQRAKRDTCHDTGQPTTEDRIIDRDNDLYDKTIKDSKTGKVIYECKEPLSKHVGHGSAKSQKQREPRNQRNSNAEKPISLRPLKFDEAVSALLKAKPPDKKTKTDKTDIDNRMEQ